MLSFLKDYDGKIIKEIEVFEEEKKRKMEDINLKKGYNMEDKNEIEMLTSKSLILMDENNYFNKSRY